MHLHSLLCKQFCFRSTENEYLISFKYVVTRIWFALTLDLGLLNPKTSDTTFYTIFFSQPSSVSHRPFLLRWRNGFRFPSCTFYNWWVRRPNWATRSSTSWRWFWPVSCSSREICRWVVSLPLGTIPCLDRWRQGLESLWPTGDLATTWLAWPVRIPCRCAPQFGRWLPASRCGPRGPSAATDSAPYTGCSVHSIPARRPAVPIGWPCPWHSGT